MHFYELHESDDDLYNDALLAHREAFDEREFFDMVMDARRRVIDSFEEDGLVAAIAHELARSHGFLYVDEQEITAAVNVSAIEADNALATAASGVRSAADEEGDDDWEDEAAPDEDDDLDEDFRTIVLRVDRPDLN